MRQVAQRVGTGRVVSESRRVADAWRLWKAVHEMELDAEFYEIACISDFKMLTLASETSIYARTAEKLSLFDDTVCFTVRSLNVLKWSKTSVIFQLTGPNNRKKRGKTVLKRP